MKNGFVRIAAAAPRIAVADTENNAKAIIDMAKAAESKDVCALVLPELSLTACTCGDLFAFPTLQKGAEDALKCILSETKDLKLVFTVGLPVKVNGVLCNCIAVAQKGSILGLVPKTTADRQFAAFAGSTEISFCGQTVKVSPDLIFSCETVPGFAFSVTFADEVFSEKALKKAPVLLCASARPELAGEGTFVRKTLETRTALSHCAIVYAAAGLGESTQDFVFSGRSLIAENGTLQAENAPFTEDMTYADIDVQLLNAETDGEIIPFNLPVKELNLCRRMRKNPFIPEEKEALRERCAEILNMQVAGLVKRLSHIHCQNAVLGLSGGLDSTLALIVTVHAFDALGLPRNNIHTATMPCFGTTARTKNNAMLLAEAYGCELKEISIASAVKQHFADIGQDMGNHDVTFENAQARERTQVLMDMANQCGGIVIGTGDLSELALGFATYNGDHMSMYGVNASVPKTVIRKVVEYEASNLEGKVGEVLRDVIATPVSPELLPPKEGGEIAQKTEDIVGPYELHDFFLYYLIGKRYSPKKVYRLALYKLGEQFDSETIKKWLRTFVWRFFAQQFKRSCLPDGPKVGSVSLSPRGDFMMPSDAVSRLWIREIEEL